MRITATVIGEAELQRRLRRLAGNMDPRRAKKAFRPAARYLAREIRKSVTAGVRRNKSKYPAWHPRRKRGTGTLRKSIKVKTHKASIQVITLPAAWYARIIEFGRRRRGGGTVMYPFFFKTLRTHAIVLDRKIREGLAMVLRQSTR